MLIATVSPRTGKSSLSQTVSSFDHLLKQKTYGEIQILVDNHRE